MALFESAVAKATFNVDKLGGENAPSSTSALTLKKRINDINLSVALTDATLRDFDAKRDLVFEATKDLGSGLKGGFEFNAGKSAAKTSLAWTNPARDVLLKGSWVERGNVFKADATVLLDDTNKVGATYDWSTRAATASYTRTEGGSALTAKYDWAKDAWSIVATTRRGKDGYKADFNLRSQGLTLEWQRKPYKLVAKGKVTGDGVLDMSAAATVEYVIDL